MNKTGARAGLAFLILILMSSCSNLLGYGVLLWSIPEEKLYSGDIVPVFIKSNISRVYVISTGEREDQKLEVPIWQLNIFSSKRKAAKYAAQFSEFRHVYAETMRDGLPMRASPDNVSDRTYRLKEGQRIKIIRKGDGAPVVSGSEELAGDWLYVLTDDGVFGWCYSYSLRLYNELEEGAVSVVADSATEKDAVLSSILSLSWYPEEFRTMVERERIDLERMVESYGFFPGPSSKFVRVEAEDVSFACPYSEIVKTDEYAYHFEGTSLSMEQRNSSTIAVQFTDEFGMPKALLFRTLPQSPSVLVTNEKERRAALFASLQKKGPSYSSNSYGYLRFLADGKFLWSGYSLLSPSIIRSGAGSAGVVSFDKFLHPTLAKIYDGVITFIFDATGQEVNFLYRIDSNGIRFEDVQTANIKDSVVQSRNMSPLILFFMTDSAQTVDSEPVFDFADEEQDFSDMSDFDENDNPFLDDSDMQSGGVF